MPFKHPSEEFLEQYLLGRLPAQQLAHSDDPGLVAIECHLLACHVCVEKAEILDATLNVVRQTLESEYPDRQPKPKTRTAV